MATKPKIYKIEFEISEVDLCSFMELELRLLKWIELDNKIPSKYIAKYLSIFSLNSEQKEKIFNQRCNQIKTDLIERLTKTDFHKIANLNIELELNMDSFENFEFKDTFENNTEKKGNLTFDGLVSNLFSDIEKDYKKNNFNQLDRIEFIRRIMSSLDKFLDRFIFPPKQSISMYSKQLIVGFIAYKFDYQSTSLRGIEESEITNLDFVNSVKDLFKKKSNKIRGKK